MKVALDTNVLVSAVATRGLCTDILHATLAEHRLVIGETVLAELRRVLRQRIRVPADTIDEMDAFLRRQAIGVDAAPALAITMRDASDLLVLAEAVAGEADVLVTGDRDLLDIAAKAPIPIVTPRGFWERLRANPEADE
ncbi:MAG: putative toxin-antitoxin system toxin component, PIN family [Armatimonadetes bacterium RBG_16_67_12]|nr:MAG: putative toxin-antitoxin system toxin component, PIN family [Armatimonadetes bacterium RBG_16_67_12]